MCDLAQQIGAGFGLQRARGMLVPLPDAHRGIPYFLGQDRLVLAVVDIAHVATQAFFVHHLAHVEGIPEHVRDGVLGETPPGTCAVAAVIEEVGDLLDRVATRSIALEGCPHNLGLCLIDLRWLPWFLAAAIAEGRDRSVVQAFPSPLALGFLRMHAQDVDVVLVDRRQQSQRKAPCRCREIELRLLDRNEADLMPSKLLEDGEGIEYRARQA